MPHLSLAPEKIVDRNAPEPHDGAQLPRSRDRDETTSQRADRNLNELLQELRVAQTGVQLLFGFLLAIAFTTVFQGAVVEQRILYVATLACCALSFILLVGPVAMHRMLFHARVKMVVVAWSHHLALVGLVSLALAVSGSLAIAVWQTVGAGWALTLGAAAAGALTTTWFVLPFALRSSVARRHALTRSRDV